MVYEDKVVNRGKSGLAGALAGGALAGMAAGGSKKKDAVVRAGAALGGLTGVVAKTREDQRMRKAAEIDNPPDTASGLRGRESSAVFSTGMEEKNIEGTNEILDGLFARKAKMAKMTEDQLSGLIKSPSHGRVRNLGPTASQASSVLGQVFRRK